MRHRNPANLDLPSGSYRRRPQANAARSVNFGAGQGWLELSNRNRSNDLDEIWARL